ncbi:MAG: hypothetical protein FRX49_08441 [Trebouxia sp. A1-2]|nr:MAG: hypothetical protein FRX49_08441 [Trebouxia sp. A1-2]
MADVVQVQTTLATVVVATAQHDTWAYHGLDTAACLSLILWTVTEHTNRLICYLDPDKTGVESDAGYAFKAELQTFPCSTVAKRQQVLLDTNEGLGMVASDGRSFAY